MKTINKDNYEAFYLDFLEGNLDEADTALLFAFLDQHPELKLEMDEFDSLVEVDVSLDHSYKQSLKHVFFDEDVITFSNIQSFLIAHTEGILSPAKEEELTRFITLHPSYTREQELFASTRLKPDYTQVFADKSSLKQVKRVALWPYLSVAAAASIALLITFGNLNTPTRSIENPVAVTPKGSIKTPVVNQKSNRIKENQAEKINSIIDNSNPGLVASAINTELIIPQEKHQPVSTNQASIGSLKTHSVKLFDVVNENEDPEMATAYMPASHTNRPKNNYTMLGFQDMKNPIEPVTNQLASVIKKEVDFRTAKATTKHSGGFYLKIGKLVISRRTV